jgi:peptide/nickel transport system permease protein
MTGYIVRRIMMGILVIILVTVIIFVLIRLLPGDPILVYISAQQYNQASIDPVQVAALRHKFGVDQPLPVQYFHWIGGVFHGDFGLSITRQESVAGLIASRLPVTLHIGIISAILSTVLGIGFGLICAIRRGSWLDTVITFLANIGITVPSFWAAILLIYLFGLQLHWLPVAGYTSPFDDFWLSARKVIMPALCMALFGLASNARMTRSSMLEVTAQDYIRTAWAKGLKERIIIVRHTIKNGLIPVVANMGFLVAGIFGGSVIVETVFNIPGIGRLMTEGILGQDYMVVQAGSLMIVVLIVMANIAVDISYGWLDPRIRYS